MSNGTILSITRITSDTSLIQHEYRDDETKDGIMYFRENVFHLELRKGLEKTFGKEVRKSDYSKFYSPGDMTFFPYANLEIKSGESEVLEDKITLHSYIGIPDSDVLDFYEIIIQDSTFEIIEGEQLGE